jgi:VanZ family protein
MRPITKITIAGIRLGAVLLAIYWVAIFVGTHLPAEADFSPRFNDKIKHFGAYFVLGTLLCYVTTSTRLSRRFGAIALVGIVYAAIDEITQKLVPGRTADVFDFLADSGGILAAIAVYLLARVCFRDRLEA